MDIDPSTIVPQLVEDFENALGVVLKAGDQRREFLQGFGYVFTTALQQVEMTGEVNLLQYAYGTYLDKLGELVGVTRLPADYADCTVQFTLSGAQPQAVQIPEGTRVTPDGALFFATTQPLTIPSGQTSGTVLCRATQPGEQYNGYLPGQINMLVDGVNYVATVSNTTESGGGADIEGDDSLRERIRMAPLAFSTAGPSGAYEYFALSADPSVGDVYVVRLQPGTVGIYVVKTGGVIPESDDPVLAAVLAACDDKTRRPLTDNVQVLPAVASNTTIAAQYWIAEGDQARAASIQAAVSQAVEDYKSWQTEQIGRAHQSRRVAEADAQRRGQPYHPHRTGIHGTGGKPGGPVYRHQRDIPGGGLMLLKALVSAVDVGSATAELILPEYDNAVTGPIPFYRRQIDSQRAQELIGKFVVLAVFGDDWNDGVIL